jgi:hypothetical protein
MAERGQEGTGRRSLPFAAIVCLLRPCAASVCGRCCAASRWLPFGGRALRRAGCGGVQAATEIAWQRRGRHTDKLGVLGVRTLLGLRLHRQHSLERFALDPALRCRMCQCQWRAVAVRHHQHVQEPNKIGLCPTRHGTTLSSRVFLHCPLRSASPVASADCAPWAP